MSFMLKITESLPSLSCMLVCGTVIICVVEESTVFCALEWTV
jgi:hypothetical protein